MQNKSCVIGAWTYFRSSNVQLPTKITSALSVLERQTFSRPHCTGANYNRSTCSEYPATFVPLWHHGGLKLVSIYSASLSVCIFLHTSIKSSNTDPGRQWSIMEITKLLLRSLLPIPQYKPKVLTHSWPPTYFNCQCIFSPSFIICLLPSCLLSPFHPQLPLLLSLVTLFYSIFASRCHLSLFAVMAAPLITIEGLLLSS